MPITYGEIAAAKADDETPRYGHSVTGYGDAPTRYWVRLSDDTTARWRRVRSLCYGNAASFYVARRGERLFLHDTDLDWALHAAGARG